MISTVKNVSIGAATSLSSTVSFYGTLKVGLEKTPAVILGGWRFAGWENTTHYPVDVVLLAEDSNGIPQMITSQYIENPSTNGTGSFVISDFNGDGMDDVFLAAHNESPLVEKPSTAFLSNSRGTLDAVRLGDSSMAQSAQLGMLDGIPTVVTAGYGDKDAYYQFDAGTGNFSVKHWGNTYSGSLYGSSAIAWDMDLDGKSELLIGDAKSGPGFDFNPTDPMKLLVYELDQASLGSAPSFVGSLRFDTDAYRDLGLVSDFAGLSHNFRVWVDDFNMDDLPDIILGVGVWSSGPEAWQKAQLQMFQNNGELSFTDVTDVLNTAYDEDKPHIDYSMQIIDIDNSGISSYLLGGYEASSAISSSYVLLNDGTGKLHIGLHPEFSAWGRGKFIAYLNRNEGLDFVLLGEDLLLSAIEVNYKPTTDFLTPIHVEDRNFSKSIRTWAGNDKFSDVGSSTDPTRIDGGLGIDTTQYQQPSSNYKVNRSFNGELTVQGDRLNDILVNVERLSFSDQSLAFDFMPEESGYKSAMLIGAAFGKDFVPAYFSAGLSLFDLGRNTAYVCDLIVGAGLIEAQIGDTSDKAWVKHVYKNVVGVDPDPLTELVLIDFLASGQFTRSSLLATAAELPLLEVQIDITGLQTTGLAYTPFI